MQTAIPEGLEVFSLPEHKRRRLRTSNACENLNQYKLNSKLRNAKQLLDNSNHSIQGIRQDCGFQSSYYFSRYFKTVTGLSPKQYRMRWGTESPDALDALKVDRANTPLPNPPKHSVKRTSKTKAQNP
jgi:hypothetical protein